MLVGVWVWGELLILKEEREFQEVKVKEKEGCRGLKKGSVHLSFCPYCVSGRLCAQTRKR